MLGCVRKIAVVAAAISLGTVSGVAAPAPAAPAAQALEFGNPASQANAWLTLSAMTASAPGASETAAPQEGTAVSSWPHVVPLSVVLGTIATSIYVLIDDEKNNPDGSAIVQGMGLRPTPLSPA